MRAHKIERAAACHLYVVCLSALVGAKKKMQIMTHLYLYISRIQYMDVEKEKRMQVCFEILQQCLVCSEQH